MKSVTAQFDAERLNKDCFCVTLNRDALERNLRQQSADADLGVAIGGARPHLFASTPVFLPRAALQQMQDTVQAIETAARLDAYRDAVRFWAPEIARQDHGPSGAFMGYDFHLDETGPKLIEINTNAGGAFLNAALARAHQACCVELEEQFRSASAENFEANVVSMFRREWAKQRTGGNLRRIAIVDDKPAEQYLYPEFVLAREVFKRQGIDAVIADAGALVYASGKLSFQGQEIDLVYNRLVDFSFAQPEHAALNAAYRAGAVVVTPNPHNHAMLADKRNLTLLSKPAAMAAFGLPPDVRGRLAAIPKTRLVTSGNAAQLWEERDALFFKPATGHGGKAVYRGDKVTKSVWQEIAQGGYVAQAFAPPAQRMIKLDGTLTSRKMDVRLYTYDGQLLLVAARLYQGQTTNFRTPGGGFAAVMTV